MAYNDDRRQDGGGGARSASGNYLADPYGSSSGGGGAGSSSYARPQQSQQSQQQQQPAYGPSSSYSPSQQPSSSRHPYGNAAHPSQSQSQPPQQSSQSQPYSSSAQHPPSHASQSHSHSHSQSQSSPHNTHQQQQQQQQQQQSMSAYGYEYNMPIFPYGYPQISGDVSQSEAGGANNDGNRTGGAHSNGSSGGGGGGGGGGAGHSPGNFPPHSYASYYHNNGLDPPGATATGGHPSGSAMAPLPEHIESGIMSSSTWLLQPGGLPLTLDMEHNSSHQGQGQIPEGVHSHQGEPGSPNHAATMQAVAATFNSAPDEDSSNWRIAVQPFPFSSGLEGISGLPVDAWNAAAAALPPPSAMDAKLGSGTPHAEDVKLLETYLNELVSLMEPFALSPSNPTPPPPPPFLHTRLSRLGTLVRETLASLEARSQPLLSAQFSQLPPGNAGMSEAEREMELIRRRRDVLIAKAAHAKRDGSAPVPRRPNAPAGQPYAAGGGPGGPGGGGRVAVAPRPPRDVWRCAGCGATASSEWKDGPDGPQSLCENCGYHYERLLRKRDGGDGDFSSVPAPGYNPNLIGMGQ